VRTCIKTCVLTPIPTVSPRNDLEQSSIVLTLFNASLHCSNARPHCSWVAGTPKQNMGQDLEETVFD
jgi:hypothetical protein